MPTVKPTNALIETAIKGVYAQFDKGEVEFQPTASGNFRVTLSVDTMKQLNAEEKLRLLLATIDELRAANMIVEYASGSKQQDGTWNNWPVIWVNQQAREERSRKAVSREEVRAAVSRTAAAAKAKKPSTRKVAEPTVEADADVEI